MRVPLLGILALPALMMGLATGPGMAQPAKGNAKDKEALAKNADLKCLPV